MIKRYLCLMAVFILLVPVPVYAWDSAGHALVAQIAYNHLSKHTKRQVNALLKRFPKSYPKSNTFVNSASWADLLKYEDIKKFNSWHYINTPFSVDGTKLKPIPKKNVIWAINYSISILGSRDVNTFEKSMFLRFLIHFVGDVHQPLHCAARVTKWLRDGDGGGNLFPIKARDNLHSYWDRGLGSFNNLYVRDHLTNRKIKRLASKIERKYPSSYFGKSVYDESPSDWGHDGFLLAKNVVYNIPVNARPSKQYQKTGQIIVQRQIALAGYRLANILNRTSF